MKSKKGVIAIVAVAVLTVAAVVGILIKKDYGSYRYNSELYPVSKAMRRAVVFRTPRLFVCGDENR